MESHVLGKNDFLDTFKQLALVDVERRLADLDAERAALSLLRRSLVARERAKRRRQNGGKGGADAV